MRASAVGVSKGGSWSCSCDSASRYGFGSRSGLADSAWPTCVRRLSASHTYLATSWCPANSSVGLLQMAAQQRSKDCVLTLAKEGPSRARMPCSSVARLSMLASNAPVA